MGQRLVFDIQRGGKRIATIYYHWSAYTLSTYEEARILCKGLKERGYNKSMTDDEVKLMLLDILLNNKYYNSIDCSVSCGGPNNDNFKPFVEIGFKVDKEKMFNINRSQGLIDINEKGMENSIKWAEWIAKFDFDSETFENSVFDYYEYGSDVYKDIFEGNEVNIDELEEFRFPEELGSCVPFDKAEEAYAWFKKTQYDKGWVLGKVTEPDGTVAIVTQVC